MMTELRIGGPCGTCGLPQLARRGGCTRTRNECPYGKEPEASPPAAMRLARMLKLYLATADDCTALQLAADTGVSESTISRFLAGKQMPDARAFAAILAWCFGDHISK